MYNKNKEISLEDQKIISLKGLSEFQKLCESSNYRFWLAYGSLIGAVRHKGFIPWDDDIDLWMPRNDYEKMLSDWSNKLIGDGWKLVSYKNSSEYLFPWTKLCFTPTIVWPSRFNNGFIYGCSIDIFPLDIIHSNSIEEADSKLKQINLEYKKQLRRIRPYTGGYKGIDSFWKKQIKKAYFNLASLVFGSVRSIIEKYDDMCKFNNTSCNKSFFSTSPCASIPWVFEVDDFNSTIELEFESKLYPVPSGYDRILRRIYGDYLKLPPEDQRVSDHSYTAFYK
ncbi:LicD family protein [Ruminococcus flavefaciens]|uniref:LicD family protein n=1 Tax=Ruminococcus flavefaciens TaxID=1265 RepID=UPI0004679321|nr:LicD family protein [Ruminococcus flavefaciens]